MAVPNFEACLAVTLLYEGGLSLARNDPGNWTGGKVGAGVLKGTNFGIAASTHPTIDIRALTMESAAIIYRRDYWHPSGADALPCGLDLSVFDAAVNSGVVQANRWLARAGRSAQGREATAHTIHAYAEARLSFLHALGSWKAFGTGWGARVAGVEAKSLRMALGASQAASDAIKAKSAKVKAQSKVVAMRAAASGATAFAGPIGTHAMTGGYRGAAVIVGIAAAIGLAILAFVSWRHAQRATALALEGAKTSLPETKGVS